MANLTDITVVVQAVILILSLICSRYLIPWLRRKLGDARFAAVITVYRRLALAAEGMFKGSNMGAEKKQWMMDQLKARGYTVDEAMLESVVHECFNLDKLTAESLQEFMPSTGTTAEATSSSTTTTDTAADTSAATNVQN